MRRLIMIFITSLIVVSLPRFIIADAHDLPANIYEDHASTEEILSPFEQKLPAIKLLEEAGILAPRALTSGSILDYPDVLTVNPSTGISDGRISSEYANLLRLTKQSKYKVVGEKILVNSYTRFYTTNTEAFDGKPHYVEVSHVAVYKGKDVDLRINVNNMLGKAGTRELDIFTPPDVNSTNFLHLQLRGHNNKTVLRYEFLDHETGKRIPYKGTWIIKRLNGYKTIELSTSPGILNSIFAYSNSALLYNTINNFNTSVISSSSYSVDTNDVRNQFMYSFDAPDGIMTQTYNPIETSNNKGTRYVYYDSVAIAPFDIPEPNIVGQVNEDYPKVSYKITQDYPTQAQNAFYPKRYKMTVQLDKVLNMEQVKFKVTNIDGRDVANLFEMTKNVSESKVYFEIGAKTLSNENFANNQYTIELESDIDWRVSRDDYIKSDGYFHIPATVKMETDINNSSVAEGIAKTKYIKGYVTLQYLLEDEKTELLPPEEKIGEIGDTFSFLQKEIPKYEYIKTNGKTAGSFGKERQVIQYIYKKIPNKAPILTFNQQSNESIVNDGKDFLLSGQVTDSDSKSMKVFYKLDENPPIEIAEFKQEGEKNKPFDYSAKVAKEKIKDGKIHQITVYAVDVEGLKSVEKSVVIKAFVGALQFISAPSSVSFGENIPISSRKKIYYMSKKERDLIIQDTRIGKGSWQLNVQLNKPLTGTSGDVIENAIRYDTKQIQLGSSITVYKHQTTDDQPINISKNWIIGEEGLNLVIPAGKARAERYTVELHWGLDDVPSP